MQQALAEGLTGKAVPTGFPVTTGLHAAFVFQAPKVLLLHCLFADTEICRGAAALS